MAETALERLDGHARPVVAERLNFNPARLQEFRR
jgi:hypothetical protein